MMKALQITAPGEVTIKDVPTPEPARGEVLVKVLAVTTCPHWDIHIFDGEPMFPGHALDYPYTRGQPGHEACGEVAAVGEGVEPFKPGQRVCAWRDRGHSKPGCYAQYVVVDEDDLIPVPEKLAPEACAPLELAMCVSAHVMYADKAEGLKGARVGVFGLGPAGLVAAQMVRAEGAEEVIGFDPNPERRELALKLGADRALDPAAREARDLPRRRTPGCLDAAFDCVGSPAAVHQAMALTGRLLVLFAVQREAYVYSPDCWTGLTLAGTQPHTREAAEHAAGLLAKGKLDLGALVTETMPLSEYPRSVELLKQQKALKVALLPQEG